MQFHLLDNEGAKLITFYHTIYLISEDKCIMKLIEALRNSNFNIALSLIDTGVNVDITSVVLAMNSGNDSVITAIVRAYVNNQGFDHGFCRQMTIEHQLQAIRLNPDFRLQYLFSYFNVDNHIELLQSIIDECCRYDLYTNQALLYLAIEKLQEDHALSSICFHINLVLPESHIATINQYVMEYILSYLSTEDTLSFIQGIICDDVKTRNETVQSVDPLNIDYLTDINNNDTLLGFVAIS